MLRGAITLTALAVTAAISAPASAATLIDQTNTAAAAVNYSFTIAATTGLTSISFAGYQVPSWEYVKNIKLVKSGATTNLLATTWGFTAAPSGSTASQAADGFGTGTNGITMGGVTAGSYDTFWQNIVTTAGSSYVLTFQYTNATGTSGFKVVSNSLPTPTPEPQTWLTMMTGFSLLGASLRQRKGGIAPKLRLRFT